MSESENNEQKFDISLKRLEEIVDEMERGQLDLESMVKKFEEGQRLVDLCERKLDEVEQKIEALVRDDTGVNTKPFDVSSSQNIGM